MAIDKEKLISLLVDKTELEPEQVEEQLSELVQRIQSAAEEGKAFEIEGFGTFSMEDENLQFTPSDRLETEINNKYAGMKPIELIGAFKEPETDVDEGTGQSKDVWAFDEEALEALEAEHDQEEAEEESTDERSEIIALEESEAESHGEDFVDKLTDTEEDSQESSQSKSLNRSEKTKQKEPQEEKDPIGQVLMVAVVIIILGAGGWLVYDMDLIGSSNSNDSSSHASQSVEDTRVPAQQTGDIQDEDSGTSDTGNGNKASDETSEPEQDIQVTKQGDTQSEPDESEQQDQSPYGLKGEFNSSISDGYMIVVHSLRERQDAEENMQGLQEEGYRATIKEALVDGTQYYRVGIGQFPTIETAQQAINRLPDPYKSNNFIRRIR